MIVTRTDSTSTYGQNQSNSTDTSSGTPVFVGEGTGYGYFNVGRMLRHITLLIEPSPCEPETNALCNMGMSIWESLHFENLEQLRESAKYVLKWFRKFLGSVCTSLGLPKFSLPTPDKGSGLLTHCGYTYRETTQGSQNSEMYSADIDGESPKRHPSVTG